MLSTFARTQRLTRPDLKLLRGDSLTLGCREQISNARVVQNAFQDICGNIKDLSTCLEGPNAK